VGKFDYDISNNCLYILPKTVSSEMYKDSVLCTYAGQGDDNQGLHQPKLAFRSGVADRELHKHLRNTKENKSRP
jgi:hypothetical protein